TTSWSFPPMTSANVPAALSRRELLCRLGGGFGALGLASILGTEAAANVPSASPLTPRPGHFAPRAKRVIFLFMNGGPSHVDTFDPKPALATYNGQEPPRTGDRVRRGGRLMQSPFRFQRHGQSGIEVSEIYPHVGGMIDDICVVRSMQTDSPAHERALL